MRALIALVFSAVLGLLGVAMTPAPAAAQYVEFGVGFGHGHGYRHHRPRHFGHHRPRHYGHRHFRHGPRYARPHYDYRGHYRPRHAWRHRPQFDIIVPVPRYSRPHYPVRRAFGHTGSHVRWCHNRYRSYRAWDNSFQPHHGGRRLCYSPYG